MYHDLRHGYWCLCIKRYIELFLEQYLTYQKVNVKHHCPHGKLQLMEVPLWKWEYIMMDFIMKLPRAAMGFDFI